MWTFNDEKDFSSSAADSARCRRINADARLDELSQAMSSPEIDLLKPVLHHLLMRLEGHSSGVTDVSFSHRGDRIVTGSVSDGTVRIWSFTESLHRANISSFR